MEKTKNRLDFINDLPSIIDSVNLSDNFVKSLENHQYFHDYVESLRALKTVREKLLFILLELTREKSTCATIVQLLCEDNQNEVANRLERFNTSTGPMGLVLDTYLPIHPSTAPKKDLSGCYDLIAERRGLCVIINNVEDQQSPEIYDKRGLLVHKPKGLKNETERFKSIFEQLFFKVEVLTNLSALQIEDRLTTISKEGVYKKDQAFALIVISHGENESILGFNACEALRKIRFGLIERNNVEALQEIARDVLSIKKLIAIFSEENCKQLMSKPKLHFYVCCRIRSPQNPNLASNQEQTKTQKTGIEDMEVETEELDTVKVNEPKKLPGFAKMDTFVSYACAEEFETFFNDDWGMSYFGQALTHSIAQYACDEPLSGIMTRTSTRLKGIYSELKKLEDEDKREDNENKKEVEPKTTIVLGNFAIEVSTYAMDKQLYFNPGKSEKF